MWEQCGDDELAQGDFLPQCFVPVFADDFEPSEGATVEVQFEEYDLIIVTQTCDLAQRKTRKVALCPVYTLSQYESLSPGFTKKHLPDVRTGRKYGLYYLRALPEQQEDGLIVDFREIYSLSFSYVSRRASSLELRWGLISPHREAFSRAFGDLFSRVALP